MASQARAPGQCRSEHGHQPATGAPQLQPAPKAKQPTSNRDAGSSRVRRPWRSHNHPRQKPWPATTMARLYHPYLQTPPMLAANVGPQAIAPTSPRLCLQRGSGLRLHQYCSQGEYPKLAPLPLPSHYPLVLSTGCSRPPGWGPGAAPHSAAFELLPAPRLALPPPVSAHCFSTPRYPSCSPAPCLITLSRAPQAAPPLPSAPASLVSVCLLFVARCPTSCSLLDITPRLHQPTAPSAAPHALATEPTNTAPRRSLEQSNCPPPRVWRLEA